MTVAAPVRMAALGTTAAVQVLDPGSAEAAAAIARDEIDAMDRAASRFRPDSDLARVNAGAGRPVRVGELAVEAVVVALRAARLTGGAVDPTVGSSLVLLGYDRDFAAVPADGDPLIVRSRPVAGWRTVWADPGTGRVRVPPGVSLDLGATAKALCADRAAAAIVSALGGGALVSLGGDVATAGTPPPGGWRIRVADVHDAAPESPGQEIAITGGGVATSGTAARRWARGGRPVHHLIDPATGLPTPPWWRTVSVAAASCVDANIASTAAIVLAERAPGWLAERRLPARLVGADGAVRTVGDWPREGLR